MIYLAAKEEYCQYSQRRKAARACDQSKIQLSGSAMDKCRTCSNYYDGRGGNFAGQPCVYAGNLCYPHNYVLTSRAQKKGHTISVNCPRQCARACGSCLLLLFCLHARVGMPCFFKFGYSPFYHPHHVHVIRPTCVYPLPLSAPSPPDWVRSEPSDCPTKCNMPKGLGTPGTVKCSETDARLCLQSAKPAPLECPATPVCGEYLNVIDCCPM